jgi:archaellum component FlaG (FlaF/FlaG flagellin family)
MKKLLYIAALISCATFTATAQEDAKTATPAAETKPNPNAAEITFEKDVHDFGTIPFGGDGTYDFKFTNTGKEPLVITNAAGSCGCTVPKWPKEPTLKGQTAVVNVHYDTKRPGPFTKTVTITSNAKTASKVITIKGTVETQEQTDSGTPVKKDNGLAPKENSNTINVGNN